MQLGRWRCCCGVVVVACMSSICFSSSVKISNFSSTARDVIFGVFFLHTPAARLQMYRVTCSSVRPSFTPLYSISVNSVSALSITVSHAFSTVRHSRLHLPWCGWLARSSWPFSCGDTRAAWADVTRDFRLTSAPPGGRSSRPTRPPA